MRLRVRLTPGAGVGRIDAAVDGVLRVRVAARPVDGAANAALVRLLADALRVAPTRITIVGGARARLKTVEIEGLDARLVRSLWPGLDV